jgi:hypothetical protein
MKGVSTPSQHASLIADGAQPLLFQLRICLVRDRYNGGNHRFEFKFS